MEIVHDTVDVLNRTMEFVHDTVGDDVDLVVFVFVVVILSYIVDDTILACSAVVMEINCNTVQLRSMRYNVHRMMEINTMLYQLVALYRTMEMVTAIVQRKSLQYCTSTNVDTIS